MDKTLTYIIIVAAALLFAGQFYFRFKILNAIRALSKKNIALGMPQILSKRRLYEDVIAHHPEHENEILATRNYIKNALLFTIGLVFFMAIGVLILYST